MRQLVVLLLAVAAPAPAAGGIADPKWPNKYLCPHFAPSPPADPGEDVVVPLCNGNGSPWNSCKFSSTPPVACELTVDLS